MLHIDKIEKKKKKRFITTNNDVSPALFVIFYVIISLYRSGNRQFIFYPLKQHKVGCLLTKSS